MPRVCNLNGHTPGAPYRVSPIFAIENKPQSPVAWTPENQRSRAYRIYIPRFMECQLGVEIDRLGEETLKSDAVDDARPPARRLTIMVLRRPVRPKGVQFAGFSGAVVRNKARIAQKPCGFAISSVFAGLFLVNRSHLTRSREQTQSLW